MPERVLIIGDGGRENALKWKLAKSPQIEQIQSIPYTTVDMVLDFANQNDIGFVVVGGEKPLSDGIVNRLSGRKIAVFGPTKEAARLEWDKAWADEFMDSHNIPHPKSHSFGDIGEALNYFQNQEPKNIVIKASGLTSGKGVILPDSQEEAKVALEDIFKGKYGKQDTVLIQERLTGREVSLICLTDGTNIIPLLPAQDHKRLKDNDEGPNTGGMGAFAPAPLDSDLKQEIMETIVTPTLNGLQKEGITYKGALYFGLMLTSDGPRVLEYNCRFGDPETQPQMVLLSTDLYLALKACVDGNLSADLINFREGSAICVVLASEGYPQNPITGREIHGLDTILDPSVEIFHSGTRTEDTKVVTNSGRVLGITAFGATLEDARQKAYSQIGDEGIHFEGMQFRKDI